MPHFDPWGWLPILKDVALLFASVGGTAWAWFRTRHAHSWPSTQGRISGAQVHRGRDSYLKPWVGSLTYTYIVNGEYFAGSHPLVARSEQKAEAKIAGWKDRMVVIRYSPRNPEISTLLKNDQPGGQLGN